MSLRILASALSCNGSLGSEPLVGFKTVAALAGAHDVTVIASPPAQPPDGVRLVLCDAGPCVFNEIDAPALLRFEARQWLAVRRLLRSERFHFIHHVTPSHIDAISLLHGFGLPMMIGPALASLPPPESFRPYLCRPMGSSKPRLHPSRITRALAFRLFKRIRNARKWFRQTVAVIAGVPSVRSQLPPWWEGEICDIPYAGVEHEVFVPPAQKPQPDRLRLLFVGRLVPYKGVELILHALARLPGHIRYEARFIGQALPIYLNHCRQTASELGIADHIRFEAAVPREQLTTAYQEADVFLMPSIETYGLALLEAMSCSLPSIVADFNGPGCILPDTAGVKIALREPEQFIADFSSALATLAANPELRGRMGQAAREHVLRFHDWDRIGQQVNTFVESVFGDAPKPAAIPADALSR